jgi:hypothetical protein
MPGQLHFWAPKNPRLRGNSNEGSIEIENAARILIGDWSELRRSLSGISTSPDAIS